MGLYGMRGKAWAFYLGLFVYILDALIYVWAQDWMSVGFHALAIFFIVKGVMSLRQTMPPVAAGPAAPETGRDTAL